MSEDEEQQDQILAVQQPAVQDLPMQEIDEDVEQQDQVVGEEEIDLNLLGDWQPDMENFGTNSPHQQVSKVPSSNVHFLRREESEESSSDEDNPHQTHYASTSNFHRLIRPVYMEEEESSQYSGFGSSKSRDHRRSDHPDDQGEFILDSDSDSELDFIGIGNLHGLH